MVLLNLSLPEVERLTATFFYVFFFIQKCIFDLAYVPNGSLFPVVHYF